MAALSTRARRSAADLIQRVGKTVTLRRSARSFDPGSGETTESFEDFTVKVSPPEPFRDGLVDGALVRSGDLETYLAAEALAFGPEPLSDALLINGGTYSLVRVEPLFAGEEIALYKLHLRK